MIDTYDPTKSLAATPFKVPIDFETCELEELMKLDFKMEHKMTKTALLHGYAIWFDAVFEGKDHREILQTGPLHPATHWYQTRLLLKEPLGINKN